MEAGFLFRHLAISKESGLFSARPFQDGVVPGRDVQVAVQTNKGVSLLRPFHENIFRIQIAAADFYERYIHRTGCR